MRAHIFDDVGCKWVYKGSVVPCGSIGSMVEEISAGEREHVFEIINSLLDNVI